MKFGLRYCNTGRYVDPGQAVELVQAGEDAGFESAWTVDHTVIPAGYSSAYPYSETGRLPGGEGDFLLPDPLIWMAYVAAATKKINLATGILILPQRNPVVTAKEVSSLDHMSGGRVLLGIGVGWLKEEFEALGAVFEERGTRTDEYVAVMREFWQSPSPTFEGRYVRFRDAYMRPKPVNGTVPIIVGGHSKLAARRAGRLGDGFFPARGRPDELIDLARRTAEECGRDPAAIEITASMPNDPAEIPAMARAGVGRLLVPVTGVAGLARVIKGPEDVLKWRDVVEKYADA